MAQREATRAEREERRARTELLCCVKNNIGERLKVPNSLS